MAKEAGEIELERLSLGHDDAVTARTTIRLSAADVGELLLEYRRQLDLFFAKMRAVGLSAGRERRALSGDAVRRM